MKYFLNDREVSWEEYHNSTEDGIYKIYHNNRVREEVPIVNGEIHGIVRTYYHNNGELAETLYVNSEERPDLLLPENRLTRAVLFGEV